MTEKKELKTLRGISTNEKLKKVEGEVQDLFEAINKCEKKVNQTQRVVNGVDRSVREFIRETQKIVTELNTKMKAQEEMLKKSLSTNEMVEDTLMNVLLAIRQNEYLQAWYPAQNGLPEKKVVGRHPLQARAQDGLVEANAG